MRLFTLALLFLFSLSGILFGYDTEDLLKKFTMEWPNCRAYSIGGWKGVFLVIDPTLIVDSKLRQKKTIEFSGDNLYTNISISFGSRNIETYLGINGPYKNFNFEAGVLRITSNVVCIPGNGAVYSGSVDDDAYYVSKIIFDGVTTQRLSNALNILNRVSMANVDLDFFTDENLSQKIGTIRKGSGIDIVGWKALSGRGNLVLIRSPVGLVGWTLDSVIADSGPGYLPHSIDYFRFQSSTAGGP